MATRFHPITVACRRFVALHRGEVLAFVVTRIPALRGPDVPLVLRQDVFVLVRGEDPVDEVSSAQDVVAALDGASLFDSLDGFRSNERPFSPAELLSSLEESAA